MSGRIITLRLTDEQMGEVLPLLNQGASAFGELTLGSFRGEPSHAHIHIGLLSTRAATKVRKALAEDASKPNTL